MSHIFQDAGKAVHFAYAIQAYPANPQSQMASVLRTLMRQCGHADDARQPSADFAGLTPVEIHGECGKIRDTVKNILSKEEAAALEAKFSPDSHAQHKAVVAVAQYFQAPMRKQVDNFDLLIKLVERHYTPVDVRGPEWSLRAIGDQFKCSKDRISRAAKLLEQHIQTLEIVALDNLRRELERKNVIAAHGQEG